MSVGVLSPSLRLSLSLISNAPIVNGKSCVSTSEIYHYLPQNSPIHQKCDGRSPKCGPCSMAKRELVCMFPLRPENRDKRNALPKGKACLSCRFVILISLSPEVSPDPPLIPNTRSKKKVRRRRASLPYLNLIPSPPLRCFRNVMDSAPPVAHVLAPATVSRAHTTRATTLPIAIQTLNRKMNPQYPPHIT